MLVGLVADGFSGRPSPLAHQLLLLPLTAGFWWLILCLLKPRAGVLARFWAPRRGAWILVVLECLFFAVLAYELHHFRQWGYRMRPVLWVGLLGPALLLLAWAAARGQRSWRLSAAAAAVAFLAGVTVSVLSFPLTYFRSDMLPVIVAGDLNLLQGVDPYRTLYVFVHTYLFPYLPGVLVAYLPAVALHMDPRWTGALCTLATAGVIIWSARVEWRLPAALLAGVFLLNPMVQYRHELYAQPHWLALMAGLALMVRGRFGWAAACFGAGCAIYQLVWVVFPFFLLHVFWRSGWRGAAKALVAAGAAAAVLDGPFVARDWRQIAAGTLGQWDHLPRALADPMNLSYWVSYAVAPNHLRYVQAVVLVGMFAWCAWRRRCVEPEDAVGWMLVALALFVMLNVLVDGYFYLTVVLLAIAYACTANGWWMRKAEHARDLQTPAASAARQGRSEAAAN